MYLSTCESTVLDNLSYLPEMVCSEHTADASKDFSCDTSCLRFAMDSYNWRVLHSLDNLLLGIKLQVFPNFPLEYVYYVCIMMVNKIEKL